MIRSIDQQEQQPVCGWIVDLVGNTGGLSPPMLAGIGPILGEGEALQFINRDGETIYTVSYRNGTVYYNDDAVIKTQKPAYTLKRPNPPVVVITTASTGSAGEAVAISFKGRPNTRTIGRETNGVPTGVIGFDLSDGARLVLATTFMADRTGKIYDGPIRPDKDTGFGPLQKGIAWLKQQPACKAG